MFSVQGSWGAAPRIICRENFRRHYCIAYGRSDQPPDQAFKESHSRNCPTLCKQAMGFSAMRASVACAP